jgi:membrane-associated phospholipid phosphatase
VADSPDLFESVLAALALLLFLAGAAAVAWWVAGRPDQVRGWVVRQADRPRVHALRHRYRRQLAFLTRRLRPSGAFGLSLTVGLVVIVAAGWAFGTLAENIIERDDLAVHDSPVAAWLAAHRVEWLTTTMRAVTWLGSGWVTIPLVIAACVVLALPGHRRRTVLTGATVIVGTTVLVHSIKFLMARPRPTLADVVATATGFAFPSGHSAQALATYGLLAYLACLHLPRWRHRVAVWTAAVVVILLVGFSRLYLGVHWLTDVLGGYALAAMWLAAVLTVASTLHQLRGTPAPARAP